MDKKTYFKVYKSKTDIGDNCRYFIDEPHKVLQDIGHWLDDHENNGEEIPIIEPIRLTDAEIKALPEFDGF